MLKIFSFKYFLSVDSKEWDFWVKNLNILMAPINVFLKSAHVSICISNGSAYQNAGFPANW